MKYGWRERHLYETQIRRLETLPGFDEQPRFADTYGIVYTHQAEPFRKIWWGSPAWLVSLQVIYLDACTFIWIVTREQRPGDESAQLAGLVGAFDRQQILPVTSALTRTEVLQCQLDDQQKHLLRRLLDPPRDQVKEVSSPILDLTSEIREY